jgi:copper homeostasis protein
MKLEVCVDSYSSILTAKRAGADRIELCSALNLGGLTPSYGLMKQVKNVNEIEVFVMIRPRSGDFLYDENEFETMKLDILNVKQMEFAGIVTGILLSNGKIDIKRMEELIILARPLKVVLHRAFDDAFNPIDDIDKLIELGVCRILTSGQKANALEGASNIAEMQKRFGDKITIMPGCGVNKENIKKIYQITKCTEYHMSGREESGRADYNFIKGARDVLDYLIKKEYLNS